MAKEERNADYMGPLREQARNDINRILEGLTTNLIARYSQVEIASWPRQRAEADAFIRAGREATLEVAPLLAKTCLYEHGLSDEPSTLLQVRKRALSVIEKSGAYDEAMAFVIGARARRFRELNGAQNYDDIAKILHDLRQEVEEIRGALAL